MLFGLLATAEGVPVSDFPGERLIACRNPLLAEDRARNREELLEVTEQKLAKIKARAERERQQPEDSTELGIDP